MHLLVDVSLLDHVVYRTLYCQELSCWSHLHSEEQSYINDTASK